MEALQKQDPAILKTLSRNLIDEAGMCGLPSVYFLFGACAISVRSCRSIPMKAPSRRLWRRLIPAGSQENGLKNRLSPTSASAWPGKASPTT